MPRSPCYAPSRHGSTVDLCGRRRSGGSGGRSRRHDRSQVGSGASPILRRGRRRVHALGAVATTLIAQEHVAYALALSAGVTLYVAASDLIPEVNREGGPGLGWTVFGGLLLFAVIDWLFTSVGGH